jgi:hypothetical protein
MLYDMRNDNAIQGLSVGASGNAGDIIGSVTRLGNAGDFTLTVADNPLRGGNALRLTNRAHDWNSITIERSIFDTTASHVYTIRVRGVATAGTKVILDAPANPFTQLGETTAGSGGSFTLEVRVAGSDLAGRHFGRGIRISTNDTADLTIQEIQISRG